MPKTRESEIRDALGYPDPMFFETAHLPDHLAQVSKPFQDMAEALRDNLPVGAESANALRRLLEAKDSVVRSVVLADVTERRRRQPRPDDDFTERPS